MTHGSNESSQQKSGREIREDLWRTLFSDELDPVKCTGDQQEF